MEAWRMCTPKVKISMFYICRALLIQLKINVIWISLILHICTYELCKLLDCLESNVLLPAWAEPHTSLKWLCPNPHNQNRLALRLVVIRHSIKIFFNHKFRLTALLDTIGPITTCVDKRNQCVDKSVDNMESNSIS